MKQDVDSAIWCFHRASEKVINFMSGDTALSYFVCRSVPLKQCLQRASFCFRFITASLV